MSCREFSLSRLMYTLKIRNRQEHLTAKRAKNEGIWTLLFIDKITKYGGGEIVKKTLKVILVVLFTILGFLHSNGYTIAYAQSSYSYTPIMGQSQDLKTQAVQLLKTNNSYNNDHPKTDEYINGFVNTTWEEATLEGIKPEVTYSLMMLETGWLKFGGRVSPDDHNFGGIGATDSGGTPAKFADDREGIRAVVQHLKAYASSDPLRSDCVDPRYELVNPKGCIINVELLGQKENPEGRGWATGFGYGFKIKNIINQLAGKPLTPIITNLTATCSDSTYSIAATGVYADGALYKFSSIDTATGRESLIQNYSQNNKADWKPDNDGNYKIKAYIKTPSSPNEFDAYTTYTIIAKASPTTIQSFDIGGTAFYAGKSYTATANATSVNKPMYKFWLGNLDTGKWTIIQDYSTKNTAAWKASTPGRYEVNVHVRDSASNKAYEAVNFKDITVKASPTTIQSFDIGGTAFYAGKSYTATANATSINKPMYKFWLGYYSNGKWSWNILRDYSASNSISWTPTKSGLYEVNVHVRDSASNEAYEAVKFKDIIARVSDREIIVLDAGHGGTEPGAVSSPKTGNIREAKINLAQTLILGNLLKEQGFTVIYTHDADIFLSLGDRTAIANLTGADLFLSIHHDSAYPNTTAKGISTHYSTYRPLLDNAGLAKKDTIYGSDITYDRTPCQTAIKSKKLAEMLVNNIATLGFNICPQENGSGAHDHNLYVTKNTIMPSVLIEAGFMSNDAEVLKVASKEVQLAIAQAIADTIIDFFNL